MTRNKVGLPRIEESKPHENITVFTPYFPVASRFRNRIPFINDTYQKWLFSRIKDSDEFSDVVNFDHTATQLFKYFKKVIYYCNDEFVGNAKYSFYLINLYHRKCENKVIKNSAFCIATSRYLTNKLRKINPNTFEIPLGGPNTGSMESEIRYPGKKDIIEVGFVGRMGNNMASNIINSLLDHKNLLLTMIGPYDKRFIKSIKKFDNITFKGVLKGQELYNEMNKFDVAIAPYNLKEINPGGTPNKLFQYLALGKPVVMVRLPMMIHYKYPDKHVYFAETERDFYDSIIKANNENNETLIKERISFAEDNSWKKRIDEFLKINNEIYNHPVRHCGGFIKRVNIAGI